MHSLSSMAREKCGASWCWAVRVPQCRLLPALQGGRQLELLKGITGAFQPGVLTALMGRCLQRKLDLITNPRSRVHGSQLTSGDYQLEPEQHSGWK